MHIHEYERYWILAVVATMGAFIAALMAGAMIFGVRVPDNAGFVNPMEVAAGEVPEFSADNLGIIDRGNGEKDVYMLAKMWAFVPGELEFEQGDRVTFYITSEDVTHGFLIEEHNINFEIVPGHISRATITFKHEGEFQFICHEYCGRAHHLMHGTITVTAPTDTDNTDDTNTASEGAS
jgi:cytochrome c oxidase subunit 2